MGAGAVEGWRVAPAGGRRAAEVYRRGVCPPGGGRREVRPPDEGHRGRQARPSRDLRRALARRAEGAGACRRGECPPGAYHRQARPPEEGHRGGQARPPGEGRLGRQARPSGDLRRALPRRAVGAGVYGWGVHPSAACRREVRPPEDGRRGQEARPLEASRPEWKARPSSVASRALSRWVTVGAYGVGGRSRGSPTGWARAGRSGDLSAGRVVVPKERAAG